MISPFTGADGLPADQLFEPIHSIALNPPKTFSAPSEGIYDLESLFDFEAATQEETVEDQSALGTRSTALFMCGELPVTVLGSLTTELDPLSMPLGVRVGDSPEMNSPTSSVSHLGSTNNDNFEATATSPPLTTLNIDIGHGILDTSSSNDTSKSNCEAVGYTCTRGNTSPRLTGVVQAAPEVIDLTICDPEPYNADPIRPIPTRSNRGLKAKKGPALKRKRSRLEPVENRKKLKSNKAQASKGRRHRREHRAIVRLDRVVFRQSGNIQARSYKWPKRAEEWQVYPPIYDYHLRSLFLMYPGSLSIYVRPGFGDSICIEWDEEQETFVCIDFPGGRLYWVSMEEMEHLLNNPEQSVEFKYWRYY